MGALAAAPMEQLQGFARFVAERLPESAIASAEEDLENSAALAEISTSPAPAADSQHSTPYDQSAAPSLHRRRRSFAARLMAPVMLALRKCVGIVIRSGVRIIGHEQALWFKRHNNVVSSSNHQIPLQPPTDDHAQQLRQR